ncbi:MAG: hypothetical protein H8D34_23710 [Chloroflexi bacterium]|nr:hypothetical protein [Chloroflexota bacterium]
MCKFWRTEELTLSAGGEGGGKLNPAVEVTLRGSIEKKYANEVSETRSHIEGADIEVPAYTKQEYMLNWQELRREGKIVYIEGGITKEARYSYRIGFELASAVGVDVPCSGVAGDDGWITVFSIDNPVIDGALWDKNSIGFSYAELTEDGRLHIAATNNTNAWQEWPLTLQLSQPFSRAEVVIELIHANGGPAGFGLSGYTSDGKYCFHLNPWSNDRDDDPPIGLGYSWVGEVQQGDKAGCWDWSKTTLHSNIPWVEESVAGKFTLQVHFTENGLDFLRDEQIVDTAPITQTTGSELMIMIRLEPGAYVDGYLDSLRVYQDTD